MNKLLTIFLQIVVLGIGLAVLAFLILEPQIEGRNQGASFFEIYFNDLFLAYAYTGSIAFFIAIYKAFKLLGYVRQNKVFSPESKKALRSIKTCALVIIGFIAGAEAYLFIIRPDDDIAGGVAMGLFIIFISTVVAATAALFGNIVQSATAIKPGNGIPA